MLTYCNSRKGYRWSREENLWMNGKWWWIRITMSIETNSFKKRVTQEIFTHQNLDWMMHSHISAFLIIFEECLWNLELFRMSSAKNLLVFLNESSYTWSATKLAADQRMAGADVLRPSAYFGVGRSMRISSSTSIFTCISECWIPLFCAG